MVEEVVSEVMEEVRLLWTEEATVDLVYCLLQLWVGLIVLPGIVPLGGWVRDGGNTVHHNIPMQYHLNCATQDKCGFCYVW